MGRKKEEIKYYEAQEELNERIKDPFEFCYLLFEWNLYPWQYSFLKDQGQSIVLCTSRQVGKTVSTALRAIFDCYHNPEFHVICLAPSQIQSSILFDKCRDYLKKSPYLNRLIVRETRTLIEFANGSKIRTLPTGIDGSSARGYTANCVIIDESQAVNEKVFEAIRPVLSTTSGRLILLGTPNRRSGMFFYAATAPDNGWSKYKVTYKANPLITEEYIENEKKNMTKDAFRKEYLAEFCEDTQSFFPAEIFYGGDYYEGCTDNYYILNQEDVRVTYYCGVDFAKTQDKSVILILQREKPAPENNWDPPATIAYLEEFQNKDYVQQVNKIVKLNTRFGFKGICIDSTGLGAVMYDMLKKNLKVMPFNFQHNKKAEAYTALKIAFEKRDILIPAERRDIIDQFTNIMQEKTPAGRLKFYPSNSGVHDDIVDALALAYNSLVNKKSVSGIRGVLR
jgi:hypothetical protein